MHSRKIEARTTRVSMILLLIQDPVTKISLSLPNKTNSFDSVYNELIKNSYCSYKKPYIQHHIYAQELTVSNHLCGREGTKILTVKAM